MKPSKDIGRTQVTIADRYERHGMVLIGPWMISPIWERRWPRNTRKHLKADRTGIQLDLFGTPVPRKGRK